jgi:hypothetical protein
LTAVSEEDARRAGHRPAWDNYIRGKKLAAAEPRPVVVELTPAEYRTLDSLELLRNSLPES